MEKRPEKCPLCGSKITKVMNATTKNYYYKCANDKCHFVLGPNYTEAEFDLQGRRMDTGCIKCGISLTVANGPSGLYPRCFNCDCDSRPTAYNGKTYPKWVNANRKNAKEELKSMIEAHGTRHYEDELYDFEAFIASTKLPHNAESESPKAENHRQITNKKSSQPSSLKERIIEVLSEQLTQPMGVADLSKILNAGIPSVRLILFNLRSEGLIKMVGYKETSAGNFPILYQLKESPLPELTTYNREDGYDTVNSFSHNRVKEFGSAFRIREVILKEIAENNIKGVLFNSSKGLCMGYPVALLESFFVKEPKQLPLPFKTTQKTSRTLTHNYQAMVINLLKEDLNKSYTELQMVKIFNLRKDDLRSTFSSLKQNKKIKAVGWDVDLQKHGPAPLRYQLAESPLPKLKTTVDNSLYMTLRQFYNKKLAGKRIITYSTAQEIANTLNVIPLLINHRAYPGYALSDLKEAFRDYLTPGTPKSVIGRKRAMIQTANSVPVDVDIDVETAIMLSKENTCAVSDPIGKKKSIFNSITSLFKKKEDVCS